MTIPELQQQQILCQRCPRLISWCHTTAANPPARFQGQAYWAGPIPSFGDPLASLLIVGLAPAAHGGNRTGRVFTGDRSGDWLFRALWKAGYANQPNSQHREDGLTLAGCYICAACHCAPPDNKPTPEELANCRPFLLEELRLLTNVKVMLGLGKIGFDAAYEAWCQTHSLKLTPKPKFGHGCEVSLPNGQILMGTYHPSQQNTFTGRLTEPMLDAIFVRARVLTQALTPAVELPCHPQG